jgi:hypothetical protein
MKIKPGQLRVVAYYKKDGFGGEDRIQRLQVYKGFLWRYWQTIDEEVVPKWAWIQKACLGSTDWISKFTEHGKFGSDGYIR